MARPRLTKERVLDVALAIADRDGLSALTIRALASELDVTPMAVYRHVESKAEILDALVELVVGASRPSAHDEPEPRAWLHETFARIRRALVAHPGVIPLLGTSASYGPNALAVLDASLSRLHAAGLPPDRAVAAFHQLLGFTIGAVAIEVAARAQRSRENARESASKARPFEARLAALGDLAARFPAIAAAAPHVVRFGSSEHFDQGLRTLLDAHLGPA